jgi:hypothetical protein
MQFVSLLVNIIFSYLTYCNKYEMFKFEFYLNSSLILMFEFNLFV